MTQQRRETTRPRPAGGTPVTLRSSWSDYEYGPYDAFPEPRRLVLEGYLMQRYDPTVGAALKIIKRLIIPRLGNYANADDARAEELVRTVLDRLEGGREQSVSTLLSALWAGFAVAAKRWRTEGNAWWIESLDLLHPMTLFHPTAASGLQQYDDQSKAGIVTDNGRPRLFRQFPERATESTVEFARDQVVYWPFMRELREEVYGRRLTDAARRSWFMRSKIEGYWALYLQRHAQPVPIFRVPKGMQLDSNGREVTNSQFYGGFIGALAPGQGLAIEADADDGFSFDLLESNVGGDAAFERVVKYHNAEAFKSMLMNPMLIEEPQHGSRAQADTSLGLTLMLVDGIREELGRVLVEDVARPLIEYNLGARDTYGEWQFEPLQDDDIEMLARAHETVARAQVIQPNPADERKARELFAEAGFATEDEITPEDLAEIEAQEQREADAQAALIEARAQQAQALQTGEEGTSNASAPPAQ